MSVTIRIDTKAATAGLSALAQSQLPFALSKAINDTGPQFQQAERARLESIFTERRKDFLEKQGVKRLGPAASKRNPSVTFGVDPKASFLDKFEAGGPRPLKSGHSIMIPEDVKRNKRDIVTTGNRPGPLLDSHKKPGLGGVFLLRTQRGKLAPGLYQRVGRGGRGIKLLFAREPKATIQPSLKFVSTFKQIVEQNWQKNFAAALNFAIRTAK